MYVDCILEAGLDFCLVNFSNTRSVAFVRYLVHKILLATADRCRKDLFCAVEMCALGSWHQAPTSHSTQAGES